MPTTGLNREYRLSLSSAVPIWSSSLIWAALKRPPAVSESRGVMSNVSVASSPTS
jgi:hypothetical protein